MDHDNDNRPRLMSVSETEDNAELSRTTIFSMARDGKFPQPVKLTERRWAFVRSEVEAWVDEKIAARNFLAERERAAA